MDEALIARLAREAGIGFDGTGSGVYSAEPADLRCFAALVAEACAKECINTAERVRSQWPDTKDMPPHAAAMEAAGAIRAKFKEPT
jgi:hypothetical protein